MVRLLAPSGPSIGEAQPARRDARESSDFCRLIHPKAIRLKGNVPIATTLRGAGDVRTATASNATPSILSLVPKLILTVCIDFREEHNRESGAIVNGTKDPLHAEDA